MKIFNDTEISCGWAYHSNTKWMTREYVRRRVKEWVEQSFETGKEQPDYDHKNQWIPHQCEWCFWFGALDVDYGFCFNTQSSNEGRICFEHGGCKFHSDYKEIVKAR